MERIGLLTITGILGGLVSGSMGQGSALILLPFFVIFNLVGDYETSVGTALLTNMAPLAFFGVVEYYKKGKVDIKVSLYLMIIISIFTYIGTKITLRIDKNIIVKASAVVYSLCSIFWIYAAYTGKFIN
jgi:uncharacterized membrane protein YfcA